MDILSVDRASNEEMFRTRVRGLLVKKALAVLASESSPESMAAAKRILSGTQMNLMPFAILLGDIGEVITNSGHQAASDEEIYQSIESLWPFFI